MKTNPTRTIQSSFSARSRAAALYRYAFAVLTALTLIGLTDQASAQGTVPERMSFQGFMEDAGGVPLGQSAPVNLPVVFRIFSTSTGGTASWAESQTVTFDKGRYSVLLGSGAQEGSEPHGTLSSVVRTNSGNLLYVETTVTLNGTPVKIAPRLRLVASPYALLATRALAADSATSATSATTAAALSGTLNVSQLSGTISNSQLAANAVNTTNIAALAVTEPKIANLAVTTAKIANGAVTSEKVGSLNASNITTGILDDARLSNNVARRSTANTFTGNQTINGSATINGNLTVTNSLSVGTSGQFKVAVGEESLRIVRGLVKLTGDVNKTPYVFGPAGMTNAFSVTRNGSYYKITFTPPFAAEPAITVCPIKDTTYGPNPDDAYAQIMSLSPSIVNINFLKPNVSGGFEVPFSFIAVGPR